MLNDLKTKVCDFAKDPNTQLFAKTFVSYSASVILTGVTFGVIGGIAAVAQNAIIKMASPK